MLIVVEFLVFVVSSGLFCSKRFRHHLWAVIIAGALAVACSLLFIWEVYERLTVPTEAPVRVVKQVVQVPVIQRVSRPPALSKARNCRDDYPFWARIWGNEGTTEVAFTVMADGTVSGAKVAKSSGHDSLDEAAVECVERWRYRPAIKDNQLVDAPMTVKVVWNLDEEDDSASATAPPAPLQPRQPDGP
jgi:TonB family protein